MLSLEPSLTRGGGRVRIQVLLWDKSDSGRSVGVRSLLLLSVFAASLAAS